MERRSRTPLVVDPMTQITTPSAVTARLRALSAPVVDLAHVAELEVDSLGMRLRSPGYRAWRAQVQATGGCTAPVHLTGSTQVFDRDGAVLLERGGTVLAPCGNRRAAV